LKPREYINKYDLDSSSRFNRDEFISDIETDYLVFLDPLLQLFGKDPRKCTVPKFETVTTTIRAKWDGIFNKSILDKDTSDKFWRYFYATVIVKYRDKMFPNFKEDQVKKKKEDKRKWKQFRGPFAYDHSGFADQYSNFFGFSSFDEYMKNFLDNIGSLGGKTEECYKILGITKDNPTDDDIKSQYRAMVKKHHPDAGGDPEEFRRITAAKEYLSGGINSA